MFDPAVNAPVGFMREEGGDTFVNSALKAC
jgi:hypothetical protein